MACGSLPSVVQVVGTGGVFIFDALLLCGGRHMPGQAEWLYSALLRNSWCPSAGQTVTASVILVLSLLGLGRGFRV